MIFMTEHLQWSGKIVEQEKVDVAQHDAEHADLATTSVICHLKATMKTDDAFILFKGMVEKDEDLDPKVRDMMMKMFREHFFALGETNRE